MWPERAILFGAKTGGRNNFLSCMPSAFREHPAALQICRNVVTESESVLLPSAFLALGAETGLRRAVTG